MHWHRLWNPSHAAQQKHIGGKYVSLGGRPSGTRMQLAWHIGSCTFWGGHQPGDSHISQRKAAASCPFGHQGSCEFIYLLAMLLLPSRARRFSSEPDESSHTQFCMATLPSERKPSHLPGLHPPDSMNDHQSALLHKQGRNEKFKAGIQNTFGTAFCWLPFKIALKNVFSPTAFRTQNTTGLSVRDKNCKQKRSPYSKLNTKMRTKCA